MKKSKLIKGSQRISDLAKSVLEPTEWTATAKIMEWINTIIKDKNLPLGIAEVETKLTGDRKRPDIVLYRGKLDEEIICLLEFKKPFYEPDDEENLFNPAWNKANKVKSPYFAISNFQYLFLYDTKKVNAQEPIEEQIIGKYSLSQLEEIKEIETPKFKNSIFQGLEKFILDLTEFIVGKKPIPLMQIDQLLIDRLRNKVDRLSPHYKRIIEDEYHKNKEFRIQLKKWFSEQMWEFKGQDSDFIKASRQTAYLLIDKIVFYNALQSKRQRQLNPISISDEVTVPGIFKGHILSYFNHVKNKIDYESIYSSTDFIDSVAFPDNDSVVLEIKNLLKILKRYNFSELGYEVIGSIFEKLIPAEERHNLGQYFTNSYIVDFILRFCLKHEQDKVLDPACGAGTFLVRAYQHKKLMNFRLKHKEIIDTLWGVDIAKFPAHLATINLAINDLSVNENYPNIIHKDFFSLKPSLEDLKLPESWREVRTVSLNNASKDTSYPRRFDCIVGNPPYTRQEEISEITPKDEKYKISLIENALLDLDGRKLAEISKRAGIHTYFFVHGTKFLKNSGRFGFIVSNSWLDVDYGKGLQEFFLNYYKIIAIIDSKVERWFEDADINTCVVILEKCNDENLRNENLVRFVYLKKRLSNFIPPANSTPLKQKERLNKIDDLINTILFHNEFYENEELRIFPKKQKELWEEGFDYKQKKFAGAKWGKYLRASEIFFKILEKGKDKFVALETVAKFAGYIHDNNISDKFFKTKIILSSRNINRIIINKTDKNVVLKGVKKSGNSRLIPDIVVPRTYDDKFLVIRNPDGILFKRFYKILVNEKEYADEICFALNSTLQILFWEYIGIPAGLGALNVYKDYFGKILIPKIDELKRLKNILKKNFGKREIKTIFEELGFPLCSKHGCMDGKHPYENIYPEKVLLDRIKPDRRELDKIIMGEILGLTDKEQLEVYRAVVDLVKSRIEKSKSVENNRKIKEGINIDLLIKNLLLQIGEENLGKFYRENVLTKPCYEKILTELEGNITIEKDLFAWRLSGDNDYITCKSEEEAKYLKNFIGTGLTTIMIPEDGKYLNQILPEITKLRENIDSIIEEDVLSIISSSTQKQVLHLLWQEIMKTEEQDGDTN